MAVPALPEPPHARDVDHLRLLSIFHYVEAALVGLTASIPLIHVAIGIAMVSGAFPSSGSGGNSAPAPEQLVGWLFVAVGGSIVLFGWSLAVATFFAGRFLALRKHRTFCFVVAVILMLNMPTGTILGICTVMVLSRDGVKAMFAGRGSGGVPADSDDPRPAPAEVEQVVSPHRG